MNLDHDLLREIQKQERKRERENQYYADEPDWMIYEDRKSSVPLNEFKGIFDASYLRREQSSIPKKKRSNTGMLKGKLHNAEVRQ